MKLLICDDDISTVDVIQNQLDCAELGISRILRAYNGEAAIRLIAQERPELILCDIGMPKVNGMEVLKYIYNNQLETEFCFLTCYENFEYAKAAVRYGASNYITKPFEIEELKAEILQMVHAARRKRAGRFGQARQDSVLNNVLRQIGDGLVSGEPGTVDSLLRRNGLNLTAQSRWHLVMTCADITDAVQTIWNRELLMYTIGRLHDEILADYIGSAYCLVDYDGRFLMCTCYVPAESCPEDALYGQCVRLMNLCMENLGVRPSILMSREFSLYQAAAVRSEMTARIPRIRVRAGKVFSMDNVETADGEQKGFLDANQILLYLKHSDQPGCLEYIATVIRQMAASGDYTRDAMDDFRRELTHIFLSCLRDNGISSQTLFEDSLLTGMNSASVLSSENMLRYAGRLFTLTLETLRSLAESDDIIAKADAYIREHFRENINREDVAAVACISPNYLSKQFHSRKGMNLREYINKIRIDEAKRLLLTTNLSVSEVAGMAGYDNISYFSTVFRKHIGMSPIDWRTSAEAKGANYETD